MASPPTSAADLPRHLADEPVEAGPSSRFYRLRKFARRNRRSLVTAAILTACVLSTAGVWHKSEWDSRQRSAQLSQHVPGLVEESERMMQENERADFENDEPFRRALELSERAKVLFGRERPESAVAVQLDRLLTVVGQERNARRFLEDMEEASISRRSPEGRRTNAGLCRGPSRPRPGA